MIKKKEEVEVEEEATTETAEATEEAAPKNVSAEKARRKAFVANYAKVSPVKYAHKKAALEKWINEA